MGRLSKCAGEPVPFLNMGKDFMHANGTATVTGDVHLRIWRRILDCPQKQQMGNGVISDWCFKMSAAVQWLSLLTCLYSAGSHGTLVSTGVPGAAAARWQLTGASSGVSHLTGRDKCWPCSVRAGHLQAQAKEGWGKAWWTRVNSCWRAAFRAGGVKSWGLLAFFPYPTCEVLWLSFFLCQGQGLTLAGYFVLFYW